ncbi:hypothetical protein [Gemmiger formicilis]
MQLHDLLCNGIQLDLCAAGHILNAAGVDGPQRVRQLFAMLSHDIASRGGFGGKLVCRPGIALHRAITAAAIALTVEQFFEAVKILRAEKVAFVLAFGSVGHTLTPST